MAHGTPSSLDEMPEYLTLVRGGRPPSAELVHEMRENYGAIGGRSPLTDITEAQAAALRARLGAGHSGRRRHAQLEAVHQGRARRAGRGRRRRASIGIPMAPQFSTLSVQKYIDAATRGAAGGHAVRGGRVVPHPSAAARRVRRARPRGAAEARRARHLHRARAAGPRHRGRRSATPTKWPRRRARVAERAGIADIRSARFRAPGRTPEPWIGPELRAGDRRSRRPASASSSSCRSASSAITRRSCSTSTSRRRRSRASSRRRCGGPSR